MQLSDPVVYYAVFDQANRARATEVARDFRARSYDVASYDTADLELERAFRRVAIGQGVRRAARAGLIACGLSLFLIASASALTGWGGPSPSGLALAFALVMLLATGGGALLARISSLDEFKRVRDALKRQDRFALIVTARRSRGPFVLSRMHVAGARLRGSTELSM